MNKIRGIGAFLSSSAGRATAVSMIALGAVAGGAFFFHDARGSKGPGAAMASPTDVESGLSGLDDTAGVAFPSAEKSVTMEKRKAQSIGVKTAPAKRGDWPERLRVTGRLELDAGKVAHVSSLVKGVVREVPVEFGQAVKKGDVLAYIDSREVGEAKLKLVREELKLTAARRTAAWHGTIHENTVALLRDLGKGKTLDEIDETFRDRPVGKYRQQLVSALAHSKKANADYDRILELGNNSIIPGKEVIRARTEQEAAKATYLALVEQIRYDSQQQLLDSQQALQAAEAAVAIGRSHLLILGYSEEDIDAMDPIAEAARVAYYPVRSPIDGTVISKNAQLSKHVDEETELMEIADLSTVWLRADVFEKDLGATRGLQGKAIRFSSASYPGQSFTANVFSLGDIVDDETRAARMLAIAENTDRMLKPGMFVEIELTPRNDAGVLQLATAAIQRHAGETFVFVSDGGSGFEKRNVKLGRSTSQLVEIDEGLADGESVVISGGFALKSEMLSELMVEE